MKYCVLRFESNIHVVNRFFTCSITYLSFKMEDIKLIIAINRMVELLEQILGQVKKWDDHPTIEKSHEEWLDAADIKKMLKIGSSALYRLHLRHKDISKTIGGKRYFSRSAIDSLNSSEPD